MRLLREELQLLQEPGSYVGEVVKVMGKKKVLVKVQPEGKYGKLSVRLQRPAKAQADAFPPPPSPRRCPGLQWSTLRLPLTLHSSHPTCVSPSAPIPVSSVGATVQRRPADDARPLLPSHVSKINFTRSCLPSKILSSPS